MRSLPAYTGRAVRPPTPTYWPREGRTERPATSGVFADSSGNVAAKGRLYPSMSRLGLALTCRGRGTRPAPRSTGGPRRRSPRHGPFDPAHVRTWNVRERNRRGNPRMWSSLLLTLFTHQSQNQHVSDCNHRLFYFYTSSLDI